MKRLQDNSDVPDARFGTLPKTILISKRKTKLHSTRPRKNGYWVLPAASTKEPEEREFVVSKKDLNSARLETMRTSRSPATVMTANGEVQTREEATVHVKQLDLFVKVMFLNETSVVLSLGCT